MTGQHQPIDNTRSLSERLDVNFALRAAGLGIWELDPVTNLVNWDDRCRELFGLAKDNVLPYEQAIAFIHPDDVDRVDQAVQQAFQPESGGQYDITYRTIGADDGLLRWVRFWGQSSFNQAGQVYRFAGVAQDVTEAVLNRQQVEESQRRFRAIVEEAPIATSLLVGRDFIVEVANTTQLAHWGKDQRVLGQPLVQVLPELVDQPFLQILDEVFTSGITYRNQQAQAQLRINDLVEKLYFDLTYKPLRSTTGEVYAILTMSSNITEQVLAQQALEEKTHLLEQQEQQWRTLVENTPDAITRWDQQRRLIFANAAFSTKTGLPIDALLGKTNLEMGQPPAVAVPYMDRLQLVLDMNQPQEHYNLFPSPKGELYYHSRLVPEIDTTGSTVGVFAIARDITALKASEERFRALIEKAPVATCLFVGRHMIVDVANAPMLAFWGKGHAVFGKPLAEAVPELNGQPFLQILDDVFTTGTRYEARSARAELEVDGVLGTYYFDFTYEPLRNAAGEVYAIINVAVDVTQQVLSRRAIEASEARLQSIIASAPAAMGLFVGRDLIVELPNQAFIDIVGKGPDIVGKPLREVMPELTGENQPFLQILDDVYTSGQTFQTFGSQVKIVRHGVMTDNYYNFTYSPLFDADGQVYAILDIAIDVTEQIKARQKLEASEAFSRNLLYSSPVANLVLVGEQMVVQTVNEGMLTMLGRDEGIIGQPFMVAMPELLPTPLLDRLRHVLTTGETFHQPEERIDLIRYGQPYTGYYHYMYTALKDDRGLPIGVVVTAIEVTSQVLARQKIEDSEARYRSLSEELDNRVQQRTQELTLANQDLKRSNDNLQQFAYVASHDLQEPLRKIQSFSSLLHDQYGDSLGESGKDLLSRMAAAGGRMSTLIKDLLTYSRISTRQQVFGQVSLEAIVASVLTTLEWDIEQRQAQISVAPLPLVRGDRSQLDQLFQNLISNALKFTPSGQIPHIQITSNECDRSQLPDEVRPTSEARSFYQISVRDRGIGFDTKYLDRIFQVFQRLHSKSEYPGTGVGLAICQRVVENHGGGITASSTPGEGATFCIYLPV